MPPTQPTKDHTRDAPPLKPRLQNFQILAIASHEAVSDVQGRSICTLVDDKYTQKNWNFISYDKQIVEMIA